MSKFDVNPNAMNELEKIFDKMPRVMDLLKSKLKRKEETLTDYTQINENLHPSLFIKGLTYSWGIWTIDREGNELPLKRVCDYIGFGGEIKSRKIN